jgi:hypothetical protein
LIKNSVFQNEEDIVWLLEYLEGYTVLDQDYGALYIELFERRGLDEHHVHALIHLELIRYEESTYYPSLEEIQIGLDERDIGAFVVTDLGRQFIGAIRHSD